MRHSDPPTGRASLTLTINGTSYALRKIQLTRGAQILSCFEVKKRGSKDQYHVSLHSHGAECTCGDFIFRRNHVDPNGCKHIRALALFGLLD